METVGRRLVMGMEALRVADEQMTADPGSFDELYHREYDGQVRRAYLMTGSGADAHDIVHDCLVGLLRNWATVRDPVAYLNRSVTNGCRRHAQRASRRVLQPVAADRVADGEPPASDEVEMGQLLLDLPFRQRAVVVLRFYGAMTEVEIAAALDIATGSVGPTLHRALDRLRGVLQ